MSSVLMVTESFYAFFSLEEGETIENDLKTIANQPHKEKPNVTFARKS